MSLNSLPVVASSEAPFQLQANLSPVQLKFVPLPAPLPARDDNAIALTVTEALHPPCRRCLLDASPGEVVHLIGYDPFSADSVSPYRGMGPIFVHAHDCALFDGDHLPASQLRRLMSVRAYNDRDMIVAAEVVEGNDLEKMAGGMLADEKARYIHVHNAKPGCFAVRIERA